MVKHLNGRELTSPVKYKDTYVPSKSVLKMPLFREFMFLWCSSHFVVAFRFSQPKPANEHESGHKMIIRAVWFPDKERCIPSCLQPSVTDYHYYLSSAEKLFVSNKYFIFQCILHFEKKKRIMKEKKRKTHSKEDNVKSKGEKDGRGKRCKIQTVNWIKEDI